MKTITTLILSIMMSGAIASATECKPQNKWACDAIDDTLSYYSYTCKGEPCIELLEAMGTRLNQLYFQIGSRHFRDYALSLKARELAKVICNDYWGVPSKNANAVAKLTRLVIAENQIISELTDIQNANHFKNIWSCSKGTRNDFNRPSYKSYTQYATQ